VQVKLSDPLRTRAIPERLRGVITTRRYTNPPLPLPYLTFRGFESRSHIILVGLFQQPLKPTQSGYPSAQVNDMGYVVTTHGKEITGAA